MANFIGTNNSTQMGNLIHHTEEQVYMNNPSDAYNPYGTAGQPIQHGFSPYKMNGGTVTAVCGDDYAVIAADTRLSEGYEILSRDSTKLHPLTTKCVMASSGCKTDVDQLRSVLDIKMKIYQHNHKKSMQITSVAQMLSTTLYGKRFFPYYAFNIMAGIDSEGKGAVYSYDAIGSFERTQYTGTGSGQAFVVPLLDSVIGNNNRTQDKPNLSKEEVVELLKDAYVSATERDIYTGDKLEIMVITKDGIETIEFELKKD